MNVGRSSTIITWEDRFEYSNTVFIYFLNITKSDTVEVRSVITISITTISNLRVYTNWVIVLDILVEALY